MSLANAVKELKAIGAPVFGGETETRISAEFNFDKQYGDEYWADYYVMTDGGSDILDDFGVNPKITKILEKHGLFAEWHNPGFLCVYKI